MARGRGYVGGYEICRTICHSLGCEGRRLAFCCCGVLDDVLFKIMAAGAAAKFDRVGLKGQMN